MDDDNGGDCFIIWAKVLSQNLVDLAFMLSNSQIARLGLEDEMVWLTKTQRLMSCMH